MTKFIILADEISYFRKKNIDALSKNSLSQRPVDVERDLVLIVLKYPSLRCSLTKYRIQKGNA